MSFGDGFGDAACVPCLRTNHTVIGIWASLRSHFLAARPAHLFGTTRYLHQTHYRIHYYISSPASANQNSPNETEPSDYVIYFSVDPHIAGQLKNK